MRPPSGDGTSNSANTPAGVILPILFAVYSVNHRLPSGPVTMSRGPLNAVGIWNSLIAGGPAP